MISFLYKKNRFLSWDFKYTYFCANESQLNGFFTFSGVKGTHKEQNASVSTVFSFIAAFQDLPICCGDRPALTTVPRLHSYIFILILYTKPKRAKQLLVEVVTSKNIQRLKMVAKNVLINWKSSACPDLKSQRLTTILEIFLDGSPFEYFNYDIKKSI